MPPLIELDDLLAQIRSGPPKRPPLEPLQPPDLLTQLVLEVTCQNCGDTWLAMGTSWPMAHYNPGTPNERRQVWGSSKLPTNNCPVEYRLGKSKSMFCLKCLRETKSTFDHTSIEDTLP